MVKQSRNEEIWKSIKAIFIVMTHKNTVFSLFITNVITNEKNATHAASVLVFSMLSLTLE